MTDIIIEETTEFIQSKILKESPLDIKKVFYIFSKKYLEDYEVITEKIKQLPIGKNVKYINFGLNLFSHFLITGFLMTNNPKLSIYLADKSIKLYYEYLKFHLESKLLTFNDIKIRIYETLIGKNQLNELSDEKIVLKSSFKLFQSIVKYFDIHNDIQKQELCNHLCNIIFKMINQGKSPEYIEQLVLVFTNEFYSIEKSNYKNDKMKNIKKLLFIKANLYLIFNNLSLSNIIDNKESISEIIYKNGEDFKNCEEFIDLYQNKN